MINEVHMKNKLLIIALSDVFLYAIQFLITPLICENVIGRGNEAIATLFISTALITLIAMLIFSDKMRLWLIGIVLYATLIVCYSPMGAYGIGIVGLDIDGLQSYYDASERYLTIAIVVALVAFIQFTIWSLVKLIKIIIMRLRD